MQTPGLEALGIVVDANGDAQARWRQVRGHCLQDFPALPMDLPTAGVLAGNASGLRLGVWILPDNRSAGMLETLLAQLIPAAQAPILDYAKEAVAAAWPAERRSRQFTLRRRTSTLGWHGKTRPIVSFTKRFWRGFLTHQVPLRSPSSNGSSACFNSTT